MASPPDLTATINAILTTTSDLITLFDLFHPQTMLLRLRLPANSIAWHKTNTQLILKSVDGQPLVYPLKAYGFLTAEDKFIRQWTYNIHGAIGQDEESSDVFIKHSSLSQSLVATAPPQQHDLAGKAMISGIGKVVKVNIDNLNEDGEWHLTLYAEHEAFDPEGRAKIQFVIIYQFGNFSPELCEMKAIEIESFMYFQGLFLRQDVETKRLIVQVVCHTVVQLLPDT
ncbi:uncharacterized protein MELLADRAFT_69601 [Melampsora larici-populina 98AG31]|uniref:Uncharacterized protein n=1 Tax=Melampsora larici-populina (strain 98AG31 / pathotype 3-4-7) TaxID=747676 RepID=F4SBB6_MELLP|nr:uncharacterized protein MELLADRAFT_69601 [Melampsora larici-populina 98AG31]EGF98064.1 hypothetical protein MELLADRAFT_69601 [Melampsora larici-populina 98AG31]